jgi:hypothetical protein
MTEEPISILVLCVHLDFAERYGARVKSTSGRRLRVLLNVKFANDAGAACLATQPSFELRLRISADAVIFLNNWF